MKYAVVAIGIVLLVLAVRLYEEGQQLTFWGSVNARVLVSTVESINAGVQHSSSSYVPRVEYEYKVEGKIYMGNSIQLGEIFYASRKQAYAISSKYPKDARIDIYYDPFKPEHSVIESHINMTNVLLFGCSGLCFLVYGIFYNKFNSWILSVFIP